MSPENQWLEDVFPTEIIPFLGDYYDYFSREYIWTNHWFSGCFQKYGENPKWMVKIRVPKPYYIKWMIWGVKKKHPPPIFGLVQHFGRRGNHTTKTNHATVPPLRRIRVLSKRRFPTDSRAPGRRWATCLDVLGEMKSKRKKKGWKQRGGLTVELWVVDVLLKFWG